jgi:hypothetical protein
VATFERRHNVAFRIDDAAGFVEFMLQDIPPAPPHTPVSLLRRNPGHRRFRRLAEQRHARRLPKGLKPAQPGELVQLDTLFVNSAPDRSVKHFTAYDPVAKWTTALVASIATAGRARALLEKVIAASPFPVTGIQVDGGSEFIAEFDQLCADQELTLFVLPPKRPQLKGAVERAVNLAIRVLRLSRSADPHRPSSRSRSVATLITSTT